jgi:hypothetical protein
MSGLTEKKTQKHGVYQWRDESDNIIYIGSTTKWTLDGLAENHRQWREKYGQSGRSDFREALVSIGQNWTVEWAQPPIECDKEWIETCEGALIRYIKPKYNKDMYPERSSQKYKRYERVLNA